MWITVGNILCYNNTQHGTEREGNEDKTENDRALQCCQIYVPDYITWDSHKCKHLSLTFTKKFINLDNYGSSLISKA